MQMQHSQNRWHLDGGEHRPLTDFAPPVPAVHPAPVPETTCRRTYDHRLRELAYHAGDPGVAQRLGVPRSTARSWMRRGMPEVVTLDVLDSDAGELRAQIVRLENRVRMLLAIVRLLFCVFRISGVRLDGDRVPSGEGKTKLLSAIPASKTSTEPSMPFLVSVAYVGCLPRSKVDFSNSMIEAFWRSMKHNWLFLNQLDTPAAVERLVAFYVTEHNSVMPHAAFNGQTPDEV